MDQPLKMQNLQNPLRRLRPQTHDFTRMWAHNMSHVLVCDGQKRGQNNLPGRQNQHGPEPGRPQPDPTSNVEENLHRV